MPPDGHLGLEVAKANRVNEALQQMVGFLASNSQISGAKQLLTSVNRSIVSANQDFQDAIDSLNLKWSYNFVLYTPQVSGLLETVKVALEEQGFRPTVWITPSASTSGDAAIEIAGEFGVDPDLLTRNKYGIIVEDIGENRSMGQSIQRIIAPYVPEEPALLFGEFEAVDMHKSFLGKHYDDHEIILVFLLPS